MIYKNNSGVCPFDNSTFLSVCQGIFTLKVIHCFIEECLLAISEMNGYITRNEIYNELNIFVSLFVLYDGVVWQR
jgi:hypothetical protein